MEEYKSNSHLSKTEQGAGKDDKKKVEKVVTGTVKVRKRSEAHKLKDIFVSEDAGNIKSYIVNDVLIPTIKQTIADIVKNVIDMTLFGSNRSRNSAASTVSYRNYYDRGNNAPRYGANRTVTGYSYDSIGIESRGEAEEVLSRMDELISCYGVVRVADLYDLVGVSGSYTDNKYGWTNISNAKPVWRNGVWVLDLPKALPID